MNNLNQLGTERKLRSEKGKHPFKNPRWVYEGEKLRVHIAALGDVGATTLMGLKLLGSDVIETIGIIDLDENRMKRYEAECNQICYPWAYDVLPKVVLLKEDELFDCDVFIFCATKGVPPVGTAVQDVRMQQLKANRSIVESYAKKARTCGYDGLFAVVSDPVEPLCNAAWQISNCNESGAFDDNGLHLEQVQGYGLGVMNARVVYYAKKNPGKYGLFLTEGRVFGPHGKSLVVADSITQYHDKESRELSKLAAEANLSVRALGFKPYIAPALSSAAISILLTMRGADHYGSVALHEIYFGCKNKYTKEGLETECQELPGQLYERIRSAYRELEEISDNC